MKMILLENALESWFSAIYYCDEIIDGKATLANKKHFVAALQNSIELFVKQQMLNITDYRVAVVKRCDSKGEPLKSYLAATDLNKFFCEISTTKVMKSFFTIDFNAIKEIQKELFHEFYEIEGTHITSALTTLQNLRNDETHFYISDKDFMTDNEFQDLHNMMIVFYKIIKQYKLFPFWGEAFGEYKKFEFERKTLKNFSYKGQLKKSEFVETFKKNIEGEMFPAGCGDEPYSITEDIVYYSNAYSESDFDDIWAYVKMLLKYNMIEITETADEEVVGDALVHGLPYREYKIKI